MLFTTGLLIGSLPKIKFGAIYHFFNLSPAPQAMSWTADCGHSGRGQRQFCKRIMSKPKRRKINFSGLQHSQGDWTTRKKAVLRPNIDLIYGVLRLHTKWYLLRRQRIWSTQKVHFACSQTQVIFFWPNFHFAFCGLNCVSGPGSINRGCPKREACRIVT